MTVSRSSVSSLSEGESLLLDEDEEEEEESELEEEPVEPPDPERDRLVSIALREGDNGVMD